MNKLLWNTFIEPLGTIHEKNRISRMVDEILKTSTGKELFERLKSRQNKKRISICFNDIDIFGYCSREKQCIELNRKKTDAGILAHELVHICQPNTRVFSSVKGCAVITKLSELEALIYEIIISYELASHNKKYYSHDPITRAGNRLYRYFLKVGKDHQQACTELAKIFWTNNVADVDLPSKYRIGKEVDHWNKIYDKDVFFRTRLGSLDNKKARLETRILNSLIKHLQINLKREYFLENGIHVYDLNKSGVEGIDAPYLGTRFIVCDRGKRITTILRFSAGRLVVADFYKNNQLYRCIDFYLNGNKKQKLYYKDGKLDGICKYYNTNGKIKKECTYKDGKLNGLWTDYFPNGKIKYEWMFKDDKANGCVINYREDGTIHNKSFFLNGIENGMRTYYREDGKTIDSIEPIINGVITGMCVAYYEDGETVEITTAFQNNKRNGPRTYYKRNGQVDHIEIYRDDRLITKK